MVCPIPKEQDMVRYRVTIQMEGGTVTEIVVAESVRKAKAKFAKATRDKIVSVVPIDDEE